MNVPVWLCGMEICLVTALRFPGAVVGRIRIFIHHINFYVQQHVVLFKSFFPSAAALSSSLYLSFSVRGIGYSFSLFSFFALAFMYWNIHTTLVGMWNNETQYDVLFTQIIIDFREKYNLFSHGAHFKAIIELLVFLLLLFL
jgi:hypothetical protein